MDSPPQFVNANTLVDGKVSAWADKVTTVTSPIQINGTNPELGAYAMMSSDQAEEAVKAASKAWGNGRGAWPQLSTNERIEAIQKFTTKLSEKREQIAHLLMWEICKNTSDAFAEVDRTIKYIHDTIAQLQSKEGEYTGREANGVIVTKKRNPIGVTLILGPFNYPFNETYAMLMPALLMGNTIVMKLPSVGGLVHALTAEIFAEVLPRGVINFVSGSARATIPRVMETGLIDIFSFIGGFKAADSLIKAHPTPHRLYSVLGLDAKNAAIVCPSADIDHAVGQCISGGFSYNGQRCTAVKIIFVHKTKVDEFVQKYADAADALKAGNPWEEKVKITPVQASKAAYIKELIEDAQSKGAKVVNKNGSQVKEGSLLYPTVVYPAAPGMRVYEEEQFGPVVPICVYEDIETPLACVCESRYGQQAAIFGTDPAELSPLVDALVNQVARVNINAAPSRGPDMLPFTGRKSSALRTLSVNDALLTYSMESLVVSKPVDKELYASMQKSAKFLQP